MTKPKIVAVIPARMGSTRFPGKPLVNILDLPMIEHVRRRAERIKLLDEVYVATCDEEIKEVVEQNGGKVIMTSDKHERCTDRIEEAAHHFDADIVINIQGDEPMIIERSIEDAIKPFLDNPNVLTTCLVYPIKNHEELPSNNVVKAVLSNSGKILYLSRSQIPGHETLPNHTYYKQSGIMGFTKDFLHKFHNLTSTTLEQKESVDMMRVLEHDYWIQGIISNDETIGIDIPEQVQEIEKLILNDPKQKEIYLSILKG